MKATQVLRDEHEGILAMLAVVETAAKRLERGKEIPSDLMTNAVGFFRPIGVMLAEHDQGRAFVRSMGDAADKYARGDKTAAPALAQSTLGYVNLLRQHIAKENNVLFPMADQVLANAEQDKLCAAFETIEKTRTGPGEHERYHAMIAAYQKIVASWV